MRIWVGNLKYGLPCGVIRDELQALFEHFGLVTEIEVNVTGRFAFVEMREKGGAVRAIAELNGKRLFGKTLRIARDRMEVQREQRELLDRERIYSSFGYRRDMARTNTSWTRTKR